MIQRYARPLFTAIACIAFASSYGQCANNNTYWQTTTPACPGTTVASTCLFGGEYQLINVVAGNTYTFSTCGTTTWDTQITLYNNTGGGVLGYNDDGCGLQSTVTWVATFTGQLRVLIDAYPCTSNSSCATLTVNCTSGVTPPPGGCLYLLNLYDSFGDGWGTSYVGVSINGGPFQNYTVAGSSNSIPIPVMPGDVVVLNYNNSGAWQGENSYTLTFGAGALFSSGTPPAAGTSYAGTVTCNPPPAPPEDCVGSITICNGQSFNNNTNNTGNVADLNLTSAGCLLNTERQGTWYNFTVSASGQIGFTINPANPADDYDFAIWGPFPPGSTPGSICPPLSAPLRCSYAAPGGATGLNFTATDLSETAFGDKWVRYLDVVVGQVYLLYISNWSQSGLAFSLAWDLQGGASLDCTILGVELLGPEATDHPAVVHLDWTTLGETGNHSFVIERASVEGVFLAIGEQQGYSSLPTVQRRFVDSAPLNGLNRYRLRIQDTDGNHGFSPEVAVIHGLGLVEATLVPNPAGDQAWLSFPSNREGTGRVEFFDPDGRLRFQESIVIQEGQNQAVISLAPLKDGPYAVRLLLPDGRAANVRLMVLR